MPDVCMFQSAYKAGHSTETALLKITSDVYDNIDGGHKTCLIAFDISAAFDTIDHRTLLTRTGNMFGVSGSVLL